jgi:hypothetical protein
LSGEDPSRQISEGRGPRARRQIHIAPGRHARLHR